MKKNNKIIALCLSFALLLAAVGGTIAWLTDNHQVQNTFSVGSVDITLSENVKVTDVQNNDVTSVKSSGDAETGYAFTNLMPGDTITKTPVVKNTGKNDAYVRVVVRVNNQTALYNVLNKYVEDGNKTVNDIFNGWNFNFEKVGDMRYTSTLNENTVNTNADGKNATILYVDEAICNYDSGSTLVTKSNHFHTDAENNLSENGFSMNGENRIQIHHDSLSREVIANASDYIYYQDLAGVYKTEGIAWIYYLKMEAGSEFTVFNGINILEEFDAEDLKAFEGLKIDVCADAIQTEGFEGLDDAITALNKAHPMSAWNIGIKNS